MNREQYFNRKFNEELCNLILTLRALRKAYDRFAQRYFVQPHGRDPGVRAAAKVCLCPGIHPCHLLQRPSLHRSASEHSDGQWSSPDFKSPHSRSPRDFYLLALTAPDILTQLFIVFVGFLLETAVFHREVPELLLHTISVLEFAANHASIWSAVSLTVDRYLALCHPLRHRQFSYPERTQKVIALVFVLALASGVPFYWWSDVWRVTHPPTAMDKALIWTHCTIIYFLPCSIFLVLNSIIIYRLKIRHRKQCREQCQQPAPRRCGKTTAILLALTTAFSILWAPRTFVIIYHLYVSTVNRNWLVHLAYDLANMLAMLNTAVNFFLYCFVSKRFRSGVRDVLLLCGVVPPARHHPLTLKPLSSSLHSSCDGKRLSGPDVTPSHF
ncbi:putative G-protein coupled receptor 142 [Acipenser oxyrinchus oxyrinchus]|uniref:G-protein coupled receptor 142 n=1 Tax=Acipenser oxyrinchus oxyrinchus TaxID=40147 RepID=A0AAD8D240_ACIOX|nr:putative G-protein coupled receptor 142 [Acipenser oxyrinchus oxyrinchus]